MLPVLLALGRLRTGSAGGAPDAGTHDPGVDPDGARCDEPAGRALSLWQIAKKGLWDHVRGPLMEGTAQAPLLAHVAWTLEESSLGPGPPAPGFVRPCPVGLLSLRLFLLEVSGLNVSAVATWAERLLLEALGLPWSRIVRSEWPLFALLHRAAAGVAPWPRLYEPLPEAAVAGTVGAVAWAEPPLEAADAAWLAVTAALKSVDSAKGLGRALLVPEAAPLWASLNKRSDEQLMARALGTPSRAGGAARYFLGHLRSEFVGSAGALGLFTQSLLAAFRALHPRRALRCWDVGAATFGSPALPLPAGQEVWQSCLAFGGSVRAFEPSREGYARLRAVAGLSVERLALSNYTGRGWLIQGGRSTGSLGLGGCGLWAPEGACGEHEREAVRVATVDALLGGAPAALDVLKVDAEGADWEVALGASGALGEGRVGLVVLEYGDKWSPDFARAAKHLAAPGPAAAPQEPTLRGVSAWFEARGYAGYLLGTRTLVPITGPHWHGAYEVCGAPHEPFYYGVGSVCWLDVAFVHASHPFAALARSMVRL